MKRYKLYFYRKTDGAPVLMCDSLTSALCWETMETLKRDKDFTKHFYKDSFSIFETEENSEK